MTRPGWYRTVCKDLVSSREHVGVGGVDVDAGAHETLDLVEVPGGARGQDDVLLSDANALHIPLAISIVIAV